MELHRVTSVPGSVTVSAGSPSPPRHGVTSTVTGACRRRRDVRRFTPRAPQMSTNTVGETSLRCISDRRPV